MLKVEVKEFLIVFLGVVGAFFSPVFGIIYALIFAAVIDHIFGLWRSVKTKERLSLWRGIWTTIVKSFLYSAILLVVFAIDKTAVNDLITAIAGKPEIQHLFTKGIALVLFAIEMYSINRSYKTVKGKSLFDALMSALGRAKKVANEVGKIKSGATGAAIVLVLLTSCRTSEQLIAKAIQKGAEFKADTVEVKVPVPKLIRGKIQYVDSIIKIPCPETEINFRPSKTEVRQEEKTKRKQVKQEGKTKRTETRKKERTEQKKTKQKAKAERVKFRWWNWLAFGFVLGSVATCLIWFLVSRVRTNRPIL